MILDPKLLSCVPEAAGTPGRLTRLYMLTCGVCKERHVECANTPDLFCDKAIEKGWRFTSEHGWVHKKCIKLMPNRIKTT